MASSLAKAAGKIPPRLMTLADLSPTQISKFIALSAKFKRKNLQFLEPAQSWRVPSHLAHVPRHVPLPPRSLEGMSIALVFSKRSTRTRVSSETAIQLLSGQALFLGKEDIQLGVNETARDTAQVLSGMCHGIFARVGEHEEIEVSLFSIDCLPS